jgi:hypothetical protein
MTWNLYKKFTTTENSLTSYTEFVYKASSVFSHWPFTKATDLFSPIYWNCPFKEKGREYWRSAWSNILWLVLTFSAHAGLRENRQFRPTAQEWPNIRGFLPCFCLIRGNICFTPTVHGFCGTANIPKPYFSAYLAFKVASNF